MGIKVTLHLDDREEVEVKVLKFSGGEVQPRLQNPQLYRPLYATITANINSSDMLMTVLMTTDALRRAYPDVKIRLRCPYFPYARQDRVCHPGEALAVEVVSKLIDVQDYHQLEIWDIHNEDSFQFLKRTNIYHRHADEFVSRIDLTNTVIVAPDKGAVKRAQRCADLTGVPPLKAEKVRDPDTGDITGTTIDLQNYIDQGGQAGLRGTENFLMVDDIADGGRTFIQLAEVLRPLTTGKINLYVTHGIFSADFHVFKGKIDHIYTPNLFEPHCRADRKPDFVTIL